MKGWTEALQRAARWFGLIPNPNRPPPSLRAVAFCGLVALIGLLLVVTGHERLGVPVLAGGVGAMLGGWRLAAGGWRLAAEATGPTVKLTHHPQDGSGSI